MQNAREWDNESSKNETKKAKTPHEGVERVGTRHIMPLPHCVIPPRHVVAS